eukprot:1149783-Pelagomonas_calceolata.AAC.4
MHVPAKARLSVPGRVWPMLSSRNQDGAAGIAWLCHLPNDGSGAVAIFSQLLQQKLARGAQCISFPAAASPLAASFTFSCFLHVNVCPKFSIQALQLCKDEQAKWMQSQLQSLA